MELGNKIKALRLRAGLTQEMLAEELDVSFQTISKWENSVCAPDISMLPVLWRWYNKYNFLVPDSYNATLY